MVHDMREEVGLKTNAALKDPTPKSTHTQTQDNQKWFNSGMCIDVSSVLNVFVCCVGVPLQEMALGKKGGLVHLTCEDFVFGSVGAQGTCPVPVSLVQGWNAARLAANSLVEKQGATSGKHMLETLNRREQMLNQIGRSFRVEVAFLASLAAQGGAQQQHKHWAVRLQVGRCRARGAECAIIVSLRLQCSIMVYSS